MHPWEKLSISGAKKLGFQVEQRDVYKQDGSISNYHLFFEDTAVHTFPIVLLGNWEINEESQLLIGAISQKFQEYPNTCIFITKEDSDIYQINIYQKIDPLDLPLFHTEPAHSTASLLWKQILTAETFRDITNDLKLNINQGVNDILK